MAYAETVLLIHHHQAQSGELHRVLQKRMGAHQDLQLAIDQVLQQLPAPPGGSGTGEQGDVHVQLGQPVGELGEMLLRQHLGGGHQGALATGLDGAQQGGEGHHGLPAAHIPLQKPCHRLGAHQVMADLGQHAVLGAGEREGEDGAQLAHQIGASSGGLQGGGRALTMLQATLGQSQLQQQKLVEHQATAAGLQIRLVRRLVDPPQGLLPAQQPELLAQRLRHGIAPLLQMGQHRLHGAAQGFGTQSLREPIDRHQPADHRGANRSARTLQHLDQGFGKGGPVGTLLHQSADRDGGAGGKLALLDLQPGRAAEAPSSKEAAHPQAAGAVLQLKLKNRQVGVTAAAEGMAAPHRGHHRGGLAGNQGSDSHKIRVIEIVAGVMGDQISHQQQAKSCQLAGGSRTDTGHLGQGVAGSRGRLDRADAAAARETLA